MAMAIEVMALTGVRRTEALTIQWKHIDLVNNRLTVITAKQRAGAPVKTRVLPMSRRLRELLVEQGEHHPEEYLIHHERDPFEPRDGRAFSRSFELVAKQAGVEVTPHQLRHRAATEMLHAGIPTQSIIKVLGHSSSKMLDVYGHSRDTAEEAAMDVLGS